MPQYVSPISERDETAEIEPESEDKSLQNFQKEKPETDPDPDPNQVQPNAEEEKPSKSPRRNRARYDPKAQGIAGDPSLTVSAAATESRAAGPGISGPGDESGRDEGPD